jgi:predicted RecB family nuclease
VSRNCLRPAERDDLVQLTGGRLIVSESDLVNFLEGPHLPALDLRVATGREVIETTRSDSADLVARKGDEHEAAHLLCLKARGLNVVEIPDPKAGLPSLYAAAEATRHAMLAGADVIYQAALVHGDWRGFADFLERVDRPSPAFGDFSYEVLDTKLARHTKPYFLVQLCFYSDLLAHLQGLQPEHMHVVLGSGARATYRVDDFFAYYKRLKGLYGERLLAGFPDTYPEPVSHCGLCQWSGACDQVRLADDHLSLVAGIGRSQRVRLAEHDITTVAALGTALPADRPKRIGAPTFERLRQQARLQVHERTTGQRACELLDPEDSRGFALLPRPSHGDLFFDMEGDPFYEDGLEYLFGVTRVENGEPVFRAFWGRDRAEEKHAFEDFVDFVTAALEDDPDLHIYHYAAYEQTALKTLMGRHGTREVDVDRLLRSGVFVDLYQVVRQALRISKPSYSIKKVEAFYMPARDEAVTDGGDSIVQFEQWLNTGDPQILRDIEAYNEVDCLSTVKLHLWLLERRLEAEATFELALPWRVAPAPRVASEQAADALDELARLRAELLAGLPEDLMDADADQHARWLMAQLLEYHAREGKPVWWAFFARCEMSPDDLTDDTEAIGALTEDPEHPPVVDKQSYIYTLHFPEQEHKLGAGAKSFDPATEGSVKVVEIDNAAGLLRMSRGKRRSDEPLPRALIPGGPYDTVQQRAALRRLAAQIIDGGLRSPGPFRAARDLLRSDAPRIAGIPAGSPLQDGAAPPIEALCDLVDGLDESCLFIQGPPGSGKTWTGAQLIVHLLKAGKRVGVTANSHKAIHNLLHEIEAAADEQHVTFGGLKKASRENPESHFDSTFGDRFITTTTDRGSFPPPHADRVLLTAGTAWLYAPETMDDAVDYLFIDEAGQLSLADTLAVTTSARNLVLLGDPLQLAHVSQAVHPAGAGCSVLEHLLGDDATIPPRRGVFLDHTRRMHPDVCRFVSEVVYENRLGSIPACAGQRVTAPGALTGTGVRFLPVAHEGNTRASSEEADVIAAAIEQLRTGTWTDDRDRTGPIALSQIMVVTPYNAQVRLLLDRLAAGVRVGTVDKFQGQEAAVVFFSMATSSGAEVPRNVEFLYSRNRLNVAVSRARCLAVLVCSPELLHTTCRSAEQMRLVNALCRLAEMAGGPRDDAPTPGPRRDADAVIADPA